MSDYLSRGADRGAPAAAPAVRPRLQSRFESRGGDSPSPSLHDDAPPSDAPPASPASSPALHAFTPALLPAFAHDTPAVPLSAARPSASDEGATQPALPRFQEHPAAAAPVLHSDPIREMESVREVRTAVTLLPVPHGGALQLPAPAAPAAVRSTNAGVLSSSTAATSRQDSIVPAVALTPVATPVPPGVRAPLLALPRTSAPAPVPAAAPAPEQRTVNITIGRLEIRAATQAPERPRAAPQPGRGPLPLDDFLSSKSPRRRTRL